MAHNIKQIQETIEYLYLYNPTLVYCGDFNLTKYSQRMIILNMLKGISFPYVLYLEDFTIFVAFY